MSVLQRLVGRADRLADRALPPAAGITVLIYHRIGGGTDSAVDLPADTFERQLEHLVAHHRIVSLDQAVDELAATTPTGWAARAEAPDSVEPAVVVTFDDGTADFVDVAAPLLERHGVPATLFAATSFIEDAAEFPWGAPPASWSGLADATASGLVAVESHSHTHPPFRSLDRTTAADELDRSIELIAERLGRAPRHFAYPKAVAASAAAEVEVRRRFVSASLARNRTNRAARTDLHRLWRTPIRRRDDLTEFARRCTGSSRLEGELRSLWTPIRHRGPT